MPDSGRRVRVGLVLSGGGAKGAYQIGCWKALHDAGYRTFDAVSGTSVGAMNALMMASGSVERGKAIWEGTRWREVVGVAPANALLFPLWAVAALVSEFSPFKIWRFADRVTHPRPAARWLYPFACFATATVLQRFALTGWAAAFAVCGAAAVLHWPLRRIALSRTLITNRPLARRLDAFITDADIERVRRSGTAVYATVSTFRPYTREAVPWAGWVPRYIRLDRLSRKEVIDTLVDGSALPAVFPAGTAEGTWRMDGAWTDNLPLAPLLEDPSVDLDLVFVLYLRQRPRHRLRANSALGATNQLMQKLLARNTVDRERELFEWCDMRWTAAGETVRRTIHGRTLPRIVAVTPSRRLGNFFTSTCWFSPAFASELIALGEEDMKRVLAELEAESAHLRTLQLNRRRRRDRLSAASAQSPA